MLNISLNSVNRLVNRDSMGSLERLEQRKSGRVLLRLLLIFSGLFFAALFLPWTQNIRANGKLTTLQPNQRPQTVQAVIGGQISGWYVREGDYVAAGDTILHLTEVKDDYFDPQLLERTQSQVQAKELSVKSYSAKVNALESQMDALRQSAKLKTEQAINKLRQSQLKVASDSINLEATRLNNKVVEDQYLRMEELYAGGLKSLTDLENRRVKYQQAQAKLIEAENKLLGSRNDVLNARVELGAIRAKLNDDLSKARSDQYSALSSQYDAEATVTKLENQYSNYERRSGLYYVVAPQAGYVTQIMSAGIGETVKPGERILSIMPENYELAVEVYVKPLDLPLLANGQLVNIQFDGWPAIVFDGWPNTSYGTYSGRIFAIDRFTNTGGTYRVLVAPDPNEEPWPDALRVGAGARSLILLKEVRVWYELWRQLNGFPPDLYGAQAGQAKKEEK